MRWDEAEDVLIWKKSASTHDPIKLGRWWRKCVIVAGILNILVVLIVASEAEDV